MSQTFLDKVLELSTLSGERTFEEHFFSMVKNVELTIGGGLTAEISEPDTVLTADIDSEELVAEICI